MPSASAVTNWYSSPGIIDVDAYAAYLDRAMTVFEHRRDTVPVMGMDLFTRRMEPNGTAKIGSTGSVTDLPTVSEDTAALNFSQPAPGFTKTVSTTQVRLALRVTRKMMETDIHGEVMNLVKGLPMAGQRKQMYAIWNLFNNGFDGSAQTYGTGADGMYLFDADRPKEDPAAGTWSNLETASALAPSTLSTMRLNFRKYTNEKGFVDPQVMTRLIVPEDLEQKAIEIRKSEKTPDNALNQINYFKTDKTFEIMVSPWLTDTNGWYGVGDITDSSKGLWFIERVPMGVMKLGYPSADYPDIIAGWRLRGDFQVAFSVPRSLRGNAGA